MSAETNEQERGVRDMLMQAMAPSDLQVRIYAAAENHLQPQLDWLAARAVGPETRTQIVKAWLDGNRQVDLALQGIDLHNSRGRNWAHEVLYLNDVWVRLSRATKRLGRDWNGSI